MKPIFITAWLRDWIAKGRKGAEASGEWSCFRVWEKWADLSEVIGNTVKNWWCEVEGHRDPKSCKEGLWDQHEKGINSNICQPYVFQHLECFSGLSCWLRFRCIALSIISSLTNMTYSPVRMKTIKNIPCYKIPKNLFHLGKSSFTIRAQKQTKKKQQHKSKTCVYLALHKETTKCLGMNC